MLDVKIFFLQIVEVGGIMTDVAVVLIFHGLTTPFLYL